MRALEQEQEPKRKMEKQIAVLGNKIKTLNFRLDRTEEIIGKRDRQALERQLGSIATIVDAVNSLKEEIEEKKFAKGEGEDEEDITSWSRDFEQHLEHADEVTRKIQSEIKTMDLQEQEEIAVEKDKKNMQFELERLDQEAEFKKSRDKEAEKNKLSSAAKLPKLSITKFNGKIEEWLPFWGEFTSEIDSKNLACLTKFGNLKELLEKNVRSDIDGLPFTDDP